jgi:aryl-alcohol dehydrogenase-like predicted oxidoreductase
MMDEKNSVFVKRLATEDNLKKVEKLIVIADELETTVSNVSLAWCLRKEIVSSVITSATKESQLKENIKASELTLTEDTLTQIEEIFKI